MAGIRGAYLMYCWRQLHPGKRLIKVWPQQLLQSLESDVASVVVTVVATDGSVPREIGATMVIGKTNCFGTIGGGNLEHSALARANNMLETGLNQQSQACEADNQIFALGPSLGQCCGGRVELYYQRVTRQTSWLKELLSHLDNGEDVWMCRCLEESAVEFIDSRQQNTQLQLPESGRDCVLKDKKQQRWACSPLTDSAPAVWLFGAGHVGQAVARQLSLLPCRVTWLDHRSEWLDKQCDLDVRSILTDTPADDIATAPDNTHYIVMTHSHALDFDICHAVLQRGQFAWLGLIGSATKRQTFINRLVHRGIKDDLISQLRCPVGSLSLQSSEPASIALSIAAELARLWEQTSTRYAAD